MSNTDKQNDCHEKFMRLAIAEAKKAPANGDVPIGAVIIQNDEVIATGYNSVEADGNALRHAEIIAINRAIEKLNYKHLLDCSIYVTLEPCPMCAGAIVLTRIPYLIYGTQDRKTGASESLYSITNDSRLNHRCVVTKDILKKQCSSLILNFFKDLRNKKAKNI